MMLLQIVFFFFLMVNITQLSLLKNWQSGIRNYCVTFLIAVFLGCFCCHPNATWSTKKKLTPLKKQNKTKQNKTKQTEMVSRSADTTSDTSRSISQGGSPSRISTLSELSDQSRGCASWPGHSPRTLNSGQSTSETEKVGPLTPPQELAPHPMDIALRLVGGIYISCIQTI